jgi:hypothetical protein
MPRSSRYRTCNVRFSGDWQARFRCSLARIIRRLGLCPDQQRGVGTESQPTFCAVFWAIWTQLTNATDVTTTARWFVNNTG